MRLPVLATGKCSSLMLCYKGAPIIFGKRICFSSNAGYYATVLNAKPSTNAPRRLLREVTAPALRAFKAHWPAILIVQALGLALVLIYYEIESTRAAFDQLAAFKLRMGVAFAAVTTMFSGFLLPELVKRIVRPKDLEPPSARELVHQLIMWAWLGILIDRFYAFQGMLFGESTTAGTLLIKVLVDQFIFSPLVSLPLTALWFMLFEANYQPRRFWEQLSFQTLRSRVVPLWAACLCFWPIMLCIVYSLPSALQFPLFLIGNAAFSIMLIFILRRPEKAE